MKIRIALVLAAALLTASPGVMGSSTIQTQNKGAANIELKAGQRGSVFFPHRRHQQKLGDCKICHSVFPQTPGVIAKQKQEGKLKKKYVMTRLCIKCHRQKKRAGVKAGPTVCSKCHVKKK